MKQVMDLTKQKMEKNLEVLHHEISKIRTGRASLAILDDVKVDYYGTSTPLNQMASLTIPDPRMIMIKPWDAKSIPEIEKAILKAQLGITPTSDGHVVRLPVPKLNEERRMEIVKTLKHKGEEHKVNLRNIRRDANEQLKNLKKDSTITEDDEKKGMEQVQKLTDEYVKKIDEAISHKEKDVMEV